MHISGLVLLLTVCATHGGVVPRALWQFAEMITCVQPGIDPFVYNEYGCYCGLGGGGTPLDAIDRCCQVHDKCYSDSKNLPACQATGALPHLKDYDFACSSEKVTCSASNDACQAAVCNCDKVAVECFAANYHTYNPDYKNLDSAIYCN